MQAEIAGIRVFCFVCSVLFSCRVKFVEETDVVFAEHTEVLDTIFEVGDSFDTHTEGVAGIFF